MKYKGSSDSFCKALLTFKARSPEANVTVKASADTRWCGGINKSQ